VDSFVDHRFFQLALPFAAGRKLTLFSAKLCTDSHEIFRRGGGSRVPAGADHDRDPRII